MPFAVHNIHAPSIEIDEAGTYTLNGTHRIPAPEPLFVAETREEAEAWRGDRAKRLRLGGVIAPREAGHEP